MPASRGQRRARSETRGPTGAHDDARRPTPRPKGSPGSTADPLVRDLRRTLASLADPAKAGPMQRYMKSALPFLGVQTPELRKACREVFARHPLADFEHFEASVLELFLRARFREERYAAIELSGRPPYRRFQTLRALPMYERMIVQGAWWDLVDPLAIHRVGPLLRAYPARMKPTLRRWSRGPDLWKRRSAILAQIAFKHDTDTAFLYECIAPSLDSREFFLQKAIGWALRSHAWTDPAEVQRYVAEHADVLPALSRREALKNAGRRRGAGAS